MSGEASSLNVAARKVLDVDEDPEDDDEGNQECHVVIAPRLIRLRERLPATSAAPRARNLLFISLFV